MTDDTTKSESGKQQAEQQATSTWCSCENPAPPSNLTGEERIKNIKSPPWDLGRHSQDFNRGYDAGHSQAISDARTVAKELDAKLAEVNQQAEALRAKYDREVLGLNNEGDPIGGDPPLGLRAQLTAATEAKERAERGVERLAFVSQVRTAQIDAYHAIRSTLNLAPDTDPQEVVDQVGRMREALRTVHNWIVCAAIASNDDMAQNFPEIERIVSVALAAQQENTNATS